MSSPSSITPQPVFQQEQQQQNSPAFSTPTTLKFTVASRTPTSPRSKRNSSSSVVSIRSSTGGSSKKKREKKPETLKTAAALPTPAQQTKRSKSKSKSNPAVVVGLPESSRTSITSNRNVRSSKQPLKVVDPARSDRSNRFCDCTNLWTFAELRSEVLTFQTRACPRCRAPFQRVIFIEKRLTVRQVLLSLRGLAILLVALLQHSVALFAAYVALLDVLLAADHRLMPVQRRLLLGLTVLFLGATVASIGRSVDASARAVVDRLGDRRIAEVLPDIHCR
ncbi:hypothetical protein TYRP_023050 [Tyrophagus putrescentiae]|nr:hypothetical protein TYRP_023050 [Tyrophagus putrescentiae]